MSGPYDVIVVGLGGMGSACAWQMARRGLRVLGLDRHGPGHAFGSSHGLNRIIRKPYYEDARYVPLVLRAYALWRDLEAASHERLLYLTGGIDAGPAGSQTVLGALRACELHGLAHEVLDAKALRARFPAFALPDDFLAVHSPDSGFVLSEAAIRAHLRLAASRGAELRHDELVLDWEAGAGRVRVRTAAGSWEAGQLVLAAGAWIGELAEPLRARAVPERQVLGWFEPLAPQLFALGRFPVFTMLVEEGEFYGFPVFGRPGFKFARHRHRHEATSPATVDRTPRAADEAILRQALARYLPAGAGRLLHAATCLYTNTPDEDFVIDRHPDHQEVLLLSPCSGHGYKFCPVIGEIAADLVTHGRTAHEIGFLGLGRFGAD